MLAFISFGKIKKIYSIKEKMPYLIRIYSLPCFKRTDIWYKTVQLYDLTFLDYYSILAPDTQPI